jgi:Mce-associated membrane protein
VAVAAVRPDGIAAAMQRTTPIALLAGLVGLAVPLALQASDRHDRDRQRAAAVAAARQEVTNLMNIRYVSAARDLDRVIAGATGDLRRQFEVQRAHVASLADSRSKLTGTIAAAGLLWLHSDQHMARVVVAAAGTDTTGGSASTLRHYRWVLTLRQSGGRWLVSDAALEGVPS